MSDKLTNAQNSRYVSVAPTNATTFVEKNKLILELDESLGYLKPRGSYLVLDVENTSNDNSRWTFPNGVGASSLIDRVDIYSRSTGQLLESLNNYNQWIGIENQYLKDDFSQSQRYEGVGNPSHQYTNGFTDADGTTSHTGVVQLDPDDVANNLLSPLKSADLTNSYTPRRFCVPLKCGLFRWWDSEKLVPILNMGGLRIEITMADNNLVCKRLGFKASLPANFEKHIVQNIETKGIKIGSINVGKDELTTDASDNWGYFSDSHNMGLVVGQKIKVGGKDLSGNEQTEEATIQTISQPASGAVSITLSGALAKEFASEIKVFALTNDSDSTPSYKVSNVEFRVIQMVVPKDGMDKLAKPMKYEYTSYDHFLNTIPMSVKRHQVPLPSVASKGKSIFSHFVNTNTDTDNCVMNYYSGLRPSELHMNSFQFFINNKLHPLNAVNPDKHADKPLTLNELVKAFRTIGKAVLKLGSGERGDLNDYSNTFLVSRELARGNFVMDLRNAEPELRLAFSNTRAFNTRVNSFVFSKKVVDISPSGVMVEL